MASNVAQMLQKCCPNVAQMLSKCDLKCGPDLNLSLRLDLTLPQGAPLISGLSPRRDAAFATCAHLHIMWSFLNFRSVEKHLSTLQQGHIYKRSAGDFLVFEKYWPIYCSSPVVREGKSLETDPRPNRWLIQEMLAAILEINISLRMSFILIIVWFRRVSREKY